MRLRTQGQVVHGQWLIHNLGLLQAGPQDEGADNLAASKGFRLCILSPTGEMHVCFEILLLIVSPMRAQESDTDVHTLARHSHPMPPGCMMTVVYQPVCLCVSVAACVATVNLPGKDLPPKSEA